MKTLLISMPWSRSDNMSMQIGALKSYLSMKGHEVDSRHYYKDISSYIGTDLYSDIVNLNLGEAVFSPFYDITRKSSVFTYLSEKLPSLSLDDYELLHKNVERFLSDIFYNDVIWGEYSCVAFSTSLVQTIPSLVVAKFVKIHFPNVKIVFGGASLVRNLAKEFIEKFSFIDFVIKGEGECTLDELVTAIENKNLSYSNIEGLLFRNGENIFDNGDRSLIMNLDELPIPDFDDYFIHKLPATTNQFPPKITIESSRGCFWGNCSFCNLNGQWNNHHRSKSPDHVIREIEYQSQRYQILDFFFTDSNVSNKAELFEKISLLKKDFTFHAEVSAHLHKSDFVAMRKAGLKDIQIGIEAFSTSLLNKYRKGVTTIRNIEMLKWCSELGIDVFYNVITGFPTTTQDDVDETYKNMLYAQYYQPPAVTEYNLAYESEVYNNYNKYHITGWELSSHFRSIFNEDFHGAIAPLLSAIVGYEVVFSTSEKDQPDWNSIVELSNYWQSTFIVNNRKSAIVCYDGRSFLNVVITLADRRINYTLTDLSRDLYLFCIDEAQSFSKIKSHFCNFPEEELLSTLSEMVDLFIMFQEGKKYFSLAVKAD